MLRKFKFPIKSALFLVLAASVLWADVKLRIYLQDGTLQAGNLVAETDDAFVILSKEGRIEVKKDKIMFINGKTLKQWQERPDKLFQTEIIPADIPNPSYVNDKAPIPSLPAPVKSAAVSAPPVIEPVKPLAAAAASAPVVPAAVPVAAAASVVAAPKPVTESVVAPAATKPVAAVAQQSVPVTPPVASAPAAPAAVKEAALTPLVAPKPRKSRRQRRQENLAAAPAPVVAPKAVKAEPVEPIAEASSAADPVAGIVRPARFVRKEMGDYHYARGVAFEKASQPGRALQELHIATMLDRQNPDAIMLLGKVYLQEGQTARATKYFSHPLVRKQDEAKKLSTEIELSTKSQERSKKILYGCAAAGALLWIPLIVLIRRLKRPSRKIISAESLEVNRNIIEDVMKEVEEEQIKQSVLGPSPVAPPAAAESGFTGFKPIPKMMEPPVPQEVAPPPAPVVPVFQNTGPIIPPPMPPPIVPPPIPAPLPVAEVPASPPPPNSEGLDTQSVLRLASMVDRAVRKGNALAVENQLDLARREYRTALALNPACVEAYLGLGYLCFTQSQWDLALEHYAKAIAIDPKSADAHYGIGRVMLETDHVDEAVYEFQKTLALDSTFDDARETLTSLGAVA